MRCLQISAGQSLLIDRVRRRRLAGNEIGVDRITGAVSSGHKERGVPIALSGEEHAAVDLIAEAVRPLVGRRWVVCGVDQENRRGISYVSGMWWIREWNWPVHASRQD